VRADGLNQPRPSFRLLRTCRFFDGGLEVAKMFILTQTRDDLDCRTPQSVLDIHLGPGSFAMEVLDAVYALDRGTVMAKARVSEGVS